MRRDMNLIRLLLLQVEGDQKPDLTEYSEDQQKYHLGLIVEAGFAHGQVMEGSDNDSGEIPAIVFASRLTWAGHEFLDAARSDTVWKKVCSRLTTAGVTVGLPILQQLLTDSIKEHLNIK